MSRLERLFTPLKLRGATMRNRINMAPMVTGYASLRGEVTDRTVAYYAARARGGAGMITVEATAVSPHGRSFARNLCVYEDAHLPGLHRLADAIRQEGALACLQLYHAGRRTSANIIGRQPVGPSQVGFKGGEVPRELGIEEIESLQGDFVAGARRAKAAGFDAVMIHSGHGYLIASFLSPISNRRTDRYGGNARNRARFGMEVIQRVRAEVGPDFPVLVRISGSEFVDGGLTIEEAKQAARWYQEAGADAIDVSGGGAETPYMFNIYMIFPRGVLVPLATAVKEAVDVPVFAVGRINDALLAESILAEGRADGISLGRALIADPEFPNKARDGRVEEICPCIACSQGCVDRLTRQLDIACLVNPAAGREQYVRVDPAPRKKRVLVVGGGIAGMQAAWAARLRGHDVELHERTGILGGQFRLAGIPPSKEEIQGFIQFLAYQVERTGVSVRLNSRLDREAVDRIAPDVVIVATGAQPAVVPVPGAELAVLSWDVLDGKVETGEQVVVIGGGQVGCETAEFLAERGRKVTVLEMLPEVAADMGPRQREPFLNSLIERGVDLITRARVTSIGVGVVSYDRAGLAEKLFGVDTVVMAVGSKADGSLVEALRGGSYELNAVGDCVQARTGLAAVHEGFFAGAEA